ncbi:MAG: Ig-like domain-containing protein, partial [Thiovulaceae bacterium]|nr:Ig-like domain-containing protein [Sulfurimonadaceae bacterium]
MAEVIGKIAHLDGKFYARVEDGSLRELSKGDTLYVGEIVIGDAGNEAIDSVIVSLNDGNDIVVLADQSQAFDQSLTQTEFTPDETVSQPSSILSMLEESGDITAEDIEAIETAAGEEGAPDSTGGMPARFAVRNDDEGQDLNVALKDAAFGELEGNPRDEMFDALEELRRANTLLSQSDSVGTTAPDTTAPNAPTITVDALTNSTTTTVHVETEAGAEVIVKDANGNEIGSGTADENGVVDIDVTLSEGENQITVTATDAAGNESSATTETVTVDTTAEAGTVTVNDIAGDNVINNAESQNPTTTVSGTATGGDISEGDTVTVTVNNKDYTTTVNEDGTYSVEVATSDLIADGTVDVSVTSQDDAGNTVESTGTTTVAVTVDTTAEAGTVTVNDIAGDNVINNAESQNPTTTVSGTATGGD